MLGSAPRAAPCLCGSSQCPFDERSTSSQQCPAACKSLAATLPASEASAVDTVDALPATIATDAPLGGLCNLRLSTSSASAMLITESQMSCDMELCTPIEPRASPRLPIAGRQASSLLSQTAVTHAVCSLDAFDDLPGDFTISTQTQKELATAAMPHCTTTEAVVTPVGVVLSGSTPIIEAGSASLVIPFDDTLPLDSALGYSELDSFAMIDRTPRAVAGAAFDRRLVSTVLASDFDTSALDGMSFSDFSVANGAPAAESSSQSSDVPVQSVEEQPAFVGFKTARGKDVAQPSESALRRARDILDRAASFTADGTCSTAGNEPVGVCAAPPATVGFATASGRSLPKPSEEALKRAAVFLEDASCDVPATVGFATASGRSIPRPSNEALERAASLMADATCDVPATVGFATASGRSIARPSEEALERAAALMAKDTSDPLEANVPSLSRGMCIQKPFEQAQRRVAEIFKKSDSFSDDALPVAPAIGFTSGKGRALAEPSEDAKRRAAEVLGRADRETQDESLTISSPPPRAMPAAKRPACHAKATSMAGNGTRPFKAPSLLDPHRAPASARLRGGSSRIPQTVRTRTVSVATRRVVFDVDTKPAVRIPLALLPAPPCTEAQDPEINFEAVVSLVRDTLPLATDAWLRNHFVEIVTKLAGYERIRAACLSGNVLCPPSSQSPHGSSLDTAKARLSKLDGSAKSGLLTLLPKRNVDPESPGAAREEAQCEPNDRPVQQDVQEHHQGTMWTLPRMDARTVADQLAYRYEREVHRSQRSVLKRACERDGPAGVLMVLYVAGIERPSGPCLPHRLVLSDGWYRLDAAHDAAIEEQVARGRIQVGTKIAVCCAQIVADEAVDILEARSRNVVLRIHGNATRPAPWHARLGLQRGDGAPPLFAISLSAVRHDGGSVPCVHVRVTQRCAPIYVFERGRGDERWSVAGDAAFEAESARVFEASGGGAVEDAPRVRMAVRIRCVPLGKDEDGTRANITLYDSNPGVHALVSPGSVLALYNLRPVGTARSAGGIRDAHVRYLSGYASARVALIEAGPPASRPASLCDEYASADPELLQERDEATVSGWLLSALGEYVWLLPARAALGGSVSLADVVAVRKVRRLPDLAEPALGNALRTAFVTIGDAEFTGRDPRMGFAVFVAQEHSVLAESRKPLSDVLTAGRVAHMRAHVLALTGHSTPA